MERVKLRMDRGNKNIKINTHTIIEIVLKKYNISKIQDSHFLIKKMSHRMTKTISDIA